MFNLSPRGPKYVIVTIGTVVLGNEMGIKCTLCGEIFEGGTQQDQIKKLFDCLGKHIPAEHLYEVYETEKGQVITQINRAVWNKAKKNMKHKM